MQNNLLPLQGIKVLEFEGLAPTVFTGMVLADYGADVILINREEKQAVGLDVNGNHANRGKKSIIINLKNNFHKNVLINMIKQSDIIIDPFRPGVLESNGLGPTQLFTYNPRIILCRISGFGQTGPYKNQAGHDINYLAMSGVLSTFGKDKQIMPFPGNILADFAGGGTYGVVGILLALIDRQRTNKGQVVDVAMHEAVGYMATFLNNQIELGSWNQPRGSNVLDGGAPFYRVFECKCGNYIAAGSLERKFYHNLLIGLGYQGENFDKLYEQQFYFDQWPEMHKEFEIIFKTKTREEWTEIFFKLDCCVTPVLKMEEVKTNKLWQDRNSLLTSQYARHPKLSNHILQTKPSDPPKRGENYQEILKKFNIDLNQYQPPKL